MGQGEVCCIDWRIDGKWLVGYDLIAPRTEYSSPDKAMRQNFDHMKTQFDGWAPVIREKVFALFEREELDKYVWQMYETKPSEWVSKSGKVAILGDAAHGFTPWIGQGGTMAVEDAVALAECLSHSTGATGTSGSSSTLPNGAKTSSSSASDCSTADLPSRLRAYQQIRQPRAFAVQARSRFLGGMYILPDGPQQEMRDQMVVKFSWDVNRVDVTADMQKYRCEWVDVMPTAESTPEEWEDWTVAFDGVEYVSSNVPCPSPLETARTLESEVKTLLTATSQTKMKLAEMYGT